MRYHLEPRYQRLKSNNTRKEHQLTVAAQNAVDESNGPNSVRSREDLRTMKLYLDAYQRQYRVDIIARPSLQKSVTSVGYTLTLTRSRSLRARIISHSNVRRWISVPASNRKDLCLLPFAIRFAVLGRRKPSCNVSFAIAIGRGTPPTDQTPWQRSESGACCEGWNCAKENFCSC